MNRIDRYCTMSWKGKARVKTVEQRVLWRRARCARLAEILQICAFITLIYEEKGKNNWYDTSPRWNRRRGIPMEAPALSIVCTGPGGAT